MEADRQAKADTEATRRRATDPQVLEDAAGETYAALVRADDLRCARQPPSFPMGLLPRLPHYA